MLLKFDAEGQLLKAKAYAGKATIEMEDFPKGKTTEILCDKYKVTFTVEVIK